MPIDLPPAPSAFKVLRQVMLGVLLTLVAWYASAILSFTGHTYGFNNRFAEVAVQHHWWYLLWSNLTLIKGYLLVAVGLAALIFPFVILWQRLRRFTGWGVVWRSAALAGLGYLYFILRLILQKPYFGDYGYMETWYTTIGVWFGKGTQDFVYFFILFVMPTVVVGFAAVFYLHLLWKRLLQSSRPLALGLVSAVVVMVAAVATGYGISQDSALVIPGSKPAPKPKNILIIGSDSLRADHLSCNGYHRPTSPAIDQIALNGMNFGQAMTPIASTLESLTTLYSSQYPHTHGVHHMFPSRETVDRANSEVPSLAGILKAQGYDSAVIGDWCACGFNELPMGFQDIIVSDFDNFKVYMSEVVYLHHQILPLFFDNRLGHSLFPKLKSFANYMTPDVVTDTTIDRLKERAEDQKPFVLFAFYSCTHLPYKTPRQYSELWTQPNYKGSHQHELALNVDEFIGSTDINERWKKFPPHEVEQVTALYDGCVRMFDDCVGRIVKTLKDEGLWDSTIVLVTADHGDDLFEPNTTFGHGLSFNGGDQGNHIPAVMHIPGMENPGRRVDKIIRTIDYAPTLLELVGHQPDSRFEGASLVPYIKGETKDLQLAYFGESSYLFFKRNVPGEDPLHIPPMDETTFIDPAFDFHFVLKPKYADAVLATKERCLRTQRFKLIRTPGKKGPIDRLFDLKADPHCESDVKANFPEVTLRMTRALERWVNEKQQSTIREILGDIDEDSIVPRL